MRMGIKDWLNRSTFWRAMSRHGSWKFVLGSFALLYPIAQNFDLAVGQLLPDWLAKRLPRIYEVIVFVLGLLPWWGWLLVVLTIGIIVSIEDLGSQLSEMQREHKQRVSELQRQHEQLLAKFEELSNLP